MAGEGGASCPHVADLERYAADVASGSIPASKHARLACERHIRDRARERTPGFPYYFDDAAVGYACRIAELYKHVKGRWAKRAEQIRLQPFQKFILGAVFAWKRVDGETRRFREAYIEMPRKNGKSMLAAIIGLLMFAHDNEAGSEVYAGATTEKQAWETFGPARLMLKGAEDISEELSADIRSRSITLPDGSKFEPIIGNPGDGSSPHCAIVDEYHEHLSPALYDTMVSGMGARDQPLLLITTTAGYDLAGPCHDKNLEVKQVLEGVLENEELFGIIFSVDVDGPTPDDWTSPAVLAKANPNMGVSVDKDFLKAQQRIAVMNAAAQNRFKTKHLNIWCSARSAWMNLQAWDACEDKQLTIEEFEGEEAWFALDLASKVDLCAFVQLFKKKLANVDHWYTFAKFYLPEDAIAEEGPNVAAYKRWAAQGHLILTEGAEVDFDIVRDDVLDLAKQFRVVEVDYDPWRATHLAHQLTREGLAAVEVRQNPKNLSEPMKEIEGAVRGGRFHHDGNPVLKWCISNITSKEDANQNVFPRREKPEKKIDGGVALITGMSRAMAPREVKPTPGIAVLG